MLLRPKQTVATVVSFVAAVYVLCAAFILLAPAASLRFFNLWFHGIDLTLVQKTPVFREVFFGFAGAVVVATALTSFFVLLWNFFNDQKEVNL
ncbi:MAG: DUF5676 family membrane protein [Nanoarchaeota archaeon]